jgi:peroxiredoxin
MLVASKNPALVMVLSPDPIDMLVQNMTEVKMGDDITIDNKKFSVLSLVGPERDQTLAIDPATHLLRRIELDVRKEIEKKGQTNVKSAKISFDYPSTTPLPATQPGAKDLFAWTPPAGAKDVTQMLTAQNDEFAATALTGKPAPDFKLRSLDGKDVSIAALKGKVVVVDFWATWCVPCQESMPHLNKIYRDNKGNGFALVGVSVDEDKTKVAPFVKEMGLVFPVVIDDQNAGVADKYSVDHYPTTFIIGKNGVVLKVLVGNSPASAEELETDIAKALQMPAARPAVPPVAPPATAPAR